MTGRCPACQVIWEWRSPPSWSDSHCLVCGGRLVSAKRPHWPGRRLRETTGQIELGSPIVGQSPVLANQSVRLEARDGHP